MRAAFVNPLLSRAQLCKMVELNKYNCDEDSPKRRNHRRRKKADFHTTQPQTPLPVDNGKIVGIPAYRKRLSIGLNFIQAQIGHNNGSSSVPTGMPWLS